MIVYVCGSKTCPRYNKEHRGTGYEEARFALVGWLPCRSCGGPVYVAPAEAIRSTKEVVDKSLGREEQE
jgi:hypothetical protein